MGISYGCVKFLLFSNYILTRSKENCYSNISKREVVVYSDLPPSEVFVTEKHIIIGGLINEK